MKELRIDIGKYLKELEDTADPVNNILVKVTYLAEEISISLLTMCFASIFKNLNSGYLLWAIIFNLFRGMYYRHNTISNPRWAQTIE